MLREIKQRFYAMRNGIVADALRKAGTPHKIIFGLQVPQIAEIARDYQPDYELAEALWEDSDVRESRLLACYLYPHDQIDSDKVLALAAQSRTPEESNMLAFRIFRRLPTALQELSRMQAATGIPEHAIQALQNHLS